MDSVISIHHPSGATASVSLFGATVFSWVLPSGKEMFYLSVLSDKTGSKPIRGGIPIVFPQFSNDGPLPKHGFVRTSIWTADPVIEEEESSVCILHFTSSDMTKKIWNHDFKLTYTIRLTMSSLTTELMISNPEGSSFECQCLLHTYYSSPSISSTFVKGLKGHNGLDSVSSSTRGEYIEEEDRIIFDCETDAKFKEVSEPITIEMADRIITVTASVVVDNQESSGADCVVWNAWIAKCHSIEDMEDDDYQKYVCVEPGCVRGRREVKAKGCLYLRQEIVASEI